MTGPRTFGMLWGIPEDVTRITDRNGDELTAAATGHSEDWRRRWEYTSAAVRLSGRLPLGPFVEVSGKK